MKETILITGAKGFIAGRLIPLLTPQYQVKLLTRNPSAPDEYAWDLDKRTIDPRALDDVSGIIHLAGAKLFDGKPLTAEKKHLVMDTRIGAADFLRGKLKERGQQLNAYVSGSAIGYYGFDDAKDEIDEQGNRGVGFNADLTEAWEQSADRFKEEAVALHVSKIRTAIALGRESGALPGMEQALKQDPQIALQSAPGNMPWVHADDLAGIFAYALTHRLDGVYNTVAPAPASNQDLFKAMANQLYDAAYKIGPFSGRHLVSRKITDAGFRFRYPDIEQAMAQLYAAG